MDNILDKVASIVYIDTCRVERHIAQCVLNECVASRRGRCKQPDFVYIHIELHIIYPVVIYGLYTRGSRDR